MENKLVDYVRQPERIGKQIGLLYGLAQYATVEDNHDGAALERMRLLSEIYRNFAASGYPNLVEDFQVGCRMGLNGALELEEDRMVGLGIGPEDCGLANVEHPFAPDEPSRG